MLQKHHDGIMDSCAIPAHAASWGKIAADKGILERDHLAAQPWVRKERVHTQSDGNAHNNSVPRCPSIRTAKELGRTIEVKSQVAAVASPSYNAHFIKRSPAKPQRPRPLTRPYMPTPLPGQGY
eukprot:scaffold120935_cov29-Tisochrysis_lutea.AAC.2